MIFYCARSTRAFRGRALREQENDQAAHLSLLTSPTSPPRGAARLSFTARIRRAQFHRGRSASKKDGLAAPHPP
jgi:hypothetical protein